MVARKPKSIGRGELGKRGILALLKHLLWPDKCRVEQALIAESAQPAMLGKLHIMREQDRAPFQPLDGSYAFHLLGERPQGFAMVLHDLLYTFSCS